MDFSWEHHLLSPLHPGIMAAVIASCVLAWPIGAATARLVFRVRDPWRRVVYLSIPVLLIALFVLILPALLFEGVWMLTHSRWVQADLYLARYFLTLPFVVFVVSAVREVFRLRTERAADV